MSDTMTAVPRIYFTGTLITPDGSDSDVYGDGCEPGEGMTMDTGWLSPDWSRFDVYENRDDVSPDVWSADDGPMIDWIVERVHARCGWVEDNHDGRTYYAREADEDIYSGKSMSVAAHIDAPESILAAVRHALRHAQNGRF